MPIAWWSTPGEFTSGARIRSNFLGFVDLREIGVVFSTTNPGEEEDLSQAVLRILADGPGLPRPRHLEQLATFGATESTA